jgi:pSer/pThr/pTyr-binding forkhead associated (FHA) protein
MAPKSGDSGQSSGLQKNKNPSASPSRTQQLIKLRLMAKPGQKDKIFKFDKERIVIGTVESADVRLLGHGISPIHSVLELKADDATGLISATIFDLASETGTFVNGRKIVTQILENGNEIIVGSYKLEFQVEEMSQPAAGDRVRKSGNRTLYLNPNEDLSPLLLQNEGEIIEIFRHSDPSSQALEVVMSWYGTILSVKHFVREKKITVGSKKNSNFGIPPILSSSQFPIVSKRGSEYVLNLDSEMKGVIHRNGTIRTVQEICSTLMRGPQGFEVSLGRNDYAKITIGEIDFYFCYSLAPPRLRRRRLLRRDPFLKKVFASSGILTSALLFALFKMEIPQHIEPEQVPERIATILYQPEKYMRIPVPEKPSPQPRPEPPTPVKQEAPKPVAKVKVEVKAVPPQPKKPLPKVMNVQPEVKHKVTPVAKVKPKSQTPVAKPLPKLPAVAVKTLPKDTPKEGEGARAKGKEGSRGELNKPKAAEKVTEISRPSPNTGDKGASGASQVSDEGNVDILKGAGGKIQNILGNSAAKFGEGGKALKGFGAFSSQGNGGLALSGTGKGGGGVAETTLGGLGNKGTGMGRVGTGKGAAGTGTGIVGSQVRVALRTSGPEESVVMGSIDRNALIEALNAHKDEFRYCYEKEVNAENPHLAGRMAVSWEIGSSGHVTQAGISSSSLNNANVERCVLTVLKRIQFPMPTGAGIVEARHTFSFHPAGH